MKKISRFWFCAILLVAFVSIGFAFADDRIENGVLYIEEGTVDVPYAKYRRNSEITSVVFPKSVKRIGYEAFRECPNLQSVEIPGTVSVIDSWAFAKCEKLENVTINKGTTAINEYSFYGCSALKNIQVPGTVSVIGKWAFGKCEALETAVLEEGVSMIVECAFYGCNNLKFISLPESLLAIGKYFPTKTVIKGIVGSYAENYAKDRNISFEPSGYSDEYGAKALELDLAHITQIPDGAYKNFTALKKLVLSPETTKIGKEAFAFSALSEVYIPATVKFIGLNAFPKTTVISCENGSFAYAWAKRNNYKTKIHSGKGLFVDVPSKAEISAYMKQNIFWTEAELQGELYETEPNFEEGFVPGVLSYTTQRNGLKALNTIRYLAGLSSVEIDNGYSSLAQLAAAANAAKGTLSHQPEKPENVSDSVYADVLKGTMASNLSKGQESLPLAILRLTRDMVGDDASVESMTHRRWILNPAMAKTGFGVADKVYAQFASDCSKENVLSNTEIIVWPPQNMPLEIATVEDPYSVFLADGFTVTDNISISMTRSGDGASWNFSKAASDGYFRFAEGGNGIHKTYIAWKPQEITKYIAGDVVEVVINGVEKDGKAYPIKYSVEYFNALPTDSIAEGILTIADNTKIITNTKYKGSSDFTQLVMPESLKKIGIEAFRECGGLQSVYIPGNVEEIGLWAFAKCPALETVEIAEGVKTIGECAFYGCDNLKIVTIPNSVNTIGKYFPKNATIRCEAGSFAQFYGKSKGINVEIIKE